MLTCGMSSLRLLFITIPKIAHVLSGTFYGKVLLLIELLYFSITRKLRLCGNDFKIEVHYLGKSFVLYLNSVVDLAVLREVFIDEEYNWSVPLDVKVIIDLGAHFGDTALYYHCKYPDATIIAVEPAPESFKRLVKHTRHIPSIIPVQAAVGAEDGEITLNIMPSSLGNSILKRKEATIGVIVPQLSLQTLCRKYNVEEVDVLKFDIEGAEFDLFRTLQEETIPIKALIGELHFDLAPTESLEKIESLFAKSEFSIEPLNQMGRYILKSAANIK